MSDPQMFRVPDVAKRLALSNRKVWQLIATGRLPAVKIDHSTRIRAEDFARYLAGLRPIVDRPQAEGGSHE